MTNSKNGKNGKDWTRGGSREEDRVGSFGAACLIFGAKIAVHLKMDRRTFLRSAARAFDLVTGEYARRKGVETEGEEAQETSPPVKAPPHAARDEGAPKPSAAAIDALTSGLKEHHRGDGKNPAYEALRAAKEREP